MRKAVFVAAAVASAVIASSAYADKPAAPPSPLSWPGFQIIMWQTKTASQYAALAQLGITAAKVQTDREGETPAAIDANIAPIAQAGLRPYVENIATDFYSPYHRWFPDHPVNWQFLEAKSQLAQEPASTTPFMRRPSLTDPAALARLRARLRATVRAYAPYRPLFFNLADEAGIADLTAFWDFDFSPSSIAGFRRWLRQQYPSLDALNREWSTGFRDWTEITPETTTAAMQRSDRNYARWSDFKAWMDVAFAHAIRAGAAAVHAAGAGARAGLEGVQIPGWGGYDYSRLAGSVDVMEMSADDVAWEIMRSLDPHVVMMSTSSLAGAQDDHIVWQHLLLGAGGLVIWDESDDFARQDGSDGPRGSFAKREFAEIRDGVGHRLLGSRPLYDPIAILYSPESFRVQWMLDHRAGGSSWTARGADTEDEDGPVRHATRAALHGLERAGFHPRFITEAQLRAGVLRRLGIRMLVLPEALALSSDAIVRSRDFVASGGSLAILGRAGLFDKHGRLRETRVPTLAIASHQRAINLPWEDDEAIQAGLSGLAANAGLTPFARIRAKDAASIRSYVSRAGKSTILALQSDLDSGGGTATPRNTIVELSRSFYAYNVGEERDLGKVSQLNISVRSGTPTVITLASEPENMMH